MGERAKDRHNARVPLPLDGDIRPWTPILTGDDADRATAAVADVASALRDPSTAEIDQQLTLPSVAGGAPGAAILFGELHAVYGRQEDAEAAFAFLDRALEQAQEDRPSLPLYTGTTGVGWTLAYMERSVLDPEEGPNDVDELVAAGLRSGKWREFDLIRGVVGTGVYLLERGLPLDDVVTALQGISTETDDGTTWWVDPAMVPADRAEMFPNGYYDVGMAHGQAGVVAVLAAGLAAGTTSAKPLLESSLAWMRAQRLPAERGPGLYPLLFGAGAEDEPPRGGRLAWCYGDAGVAVALLAAGMALGDDSVLNEAREVAHACTMRPVHQAGVLDQSLCHGSSGLALLYARLAHAFGDEPLYEAARTWARIALEQRATGDDIAGFRYSTPKDDSDERGWEARAGLLEGAVGAALTLHALSTERAPDWDVLLLSRPVR